MPVNPNYFIYERRNKEGDIIEEIIINRLGIL